MRRQGSFALLRCFIVPHPLNELCLILAFHLLLHRHGVQPKVRLHLLIIEHDLWVDEALRPEVEEVLRFHSLLISHRCENFVTD